MQRASLQTLKSLLPYSTRAKYNTTMLAAAGPPSDIVQHNVDVVIVGAGLAGLTIANELEKHEKSWNYMILEARDMLGGRLINDNKHDDIDLGGAWFWPPEQELVSQLVHDLDIQTFEQPPIHPFMSTRRFEGGAVQLIRRLSKRIPEDRIMLNTPVTKCEQITVDSEQGQQCANVDDGNDNKGTKIRLQATRRNGQSSGGTQSSNEVVVHAKHVVFCVPPRLLAKHVTFNPPLSPTKQRAMQQSDTWMAGVTKVALVYKEPFWNEDYQFQNLIGRLAGPAFQMYDSSTDKISALTAFTLATQIGTTKDNDDENKNLAKKVASQIAQSFQLLGDTEKSKLALSFEEYFIQRWPLETYISEEPYPKRIQPHPHPVQALSTMEWSGRLLFAGTETDESSPGVMEGAIGSALRSVEQLKAQT